MAELMLVNPRRRKRKKTRRIKTRGRRRTYTKRRRTYAKRRRNPVRRTGKWSSMIMPAATNAVGALALDIAWAYLPIPASIQMGPFRHVAKGAGAIALSEIASKVVGRSTANSMGLGALTVVMHGAMREVTQQMLPNVSLGYYSPGMPAGVGQYVNGLGGLDAYTSGGGSVSPYLADDTLAKPFAGPSAAQACAAREANHTY